MQLAAKPKYLQIPQKSTVAGISGNQVVNLLNLNPPSIRLEKNAICNTMIFTQNLFVPYAQQ